MATPQQRLALGVEYYGAGISGWQIQRSPELPTVQGYLQQALGRIATQPITVHCAGRTDAGVHATGQVVHFDSPVQRPLKAWVQGVNSYLPDSVVVHWAVPVSADFHARFSALSRRYRYVIYCSPTRPAVLSQGLTWHRGELDVAAMHLAAQCLLGEQDFSAFRAAGCQSNSPNRCVTQVSVQRQGRFLVLDIEANAFLLHMVRNIAGSLIAVGRGDQGVHWLAELLAGRDRTLAAPTASPAGLYLVQVRYPAHFGLPQASPGPHFLA